MLPLLALYTRRASTRAAGVLSKFSPYIIFLGHIINSVPPTFSSPTVVFPKYFLYTPLQYKISFYIPTFHLLSIFLLLLIESGPTETVVGGERARAAPGGRESSTACAVACSAAAFSGVL